jgi:hypothetical protein
MRSQAESGHAFFSRQSKTAFPENHQSLFWTFAAICSKFSIICEAAVGEGHG